MHQSGRLGVYNTKALNLMGISAETEDPLGGIKSDDVVECLPAL